VAGPFGDVLPGTRPNAPSSPAAANPDETSMSHAPDSPEELPDAPDDDEKLSIRTIAARLNQRSQAVQIASNEAPEDGDREPMYAVPSPAPATSNPLEVLAKPSKRRSSPTIVPTDCLHNDAGRGVSTPRKRSASGRQGSRHGSFTAS
jgi:hypothetical protein